MNVNLHIERLVLEGLRVGNHDVVLVQQAVQTELTRLFVQNEASAASLASTAVPSVQGEPVRVLSAGTAGQLGAAIAQSVYGAIRG